MAKHDESKDIRSVSKIGKVDYSNHTITLNRNKTIGIKMWGKLDFLRHYCGYTVIWDNSVIIDKFGSDYNKQEITKERIKKHNKMK